MRRFYTPPCTPLTLHRHVPNNRATRAGNWRPRFDDVRGRDGEPTITVYLKSFKRLANFMSVRHVDIRGQGGQRLDNFLFAELKGVPKSRIYRMVRRGEVRVNGRRSAIGYRLAEGDTVRIPPVRTAKAAARPALQTGWITSSVLFEDDDLLVLDKPAGLAVHG